jgi:hypothetical protein
MTASPEVFRVQIEATGERAALVRIRKRGDIREIHETITRWLDKVRTGTACKALVITVHLPTCDHEDP